jgi:uncharacterized membrane protein YccC
MKKFTFRLDSVLRLYQVKLEIEKAKLSKALAEEQQILGALSRRAEEVRQENEAIREQIELRSGDLRALSTYNLSAQTHTIALHESLARVRRSIRSQRESVLREERKVKLVSKLRDRQYLAWQEALSRQVEADAQEVWIAVHGKRGSQPERISLISSKHDRGTDCPS